MAEIKISELEETNDLNGLFTIGTDKNNLSKKVALQFLKDAANYANAQGEYAQMVADNIYGNVGVADYPAFNPSENYSVGKVVIYNGVLYQFTANHAAGDWNGKDVKPTSINTIIKDILADLEISDPSVPGGGESSITKEEVEVAITIMAESIRQDIIDNEEVTAAALNDLNDKKASKEDVTNAIAEAITQTLNTAV